MTTTFKQFLETQGNVQEGINDKGIFKAVFVIGSPASGKSYTISTLKGTTEPRVVNTDKAFEFLANKDNVVASSDTWRGVYRDSSKRITTTRLYHFLNGALPLFIDSTSANVTTLLNRKEILEDLGYDTALIFIRTDVEVAVARAQERAERIGRSVDEAFVRQVWTNTEKALEGLEAEFGGAYIINNDPGEYDDDAMLKAYRKTAGFFDGPVENPIGQQAMEKMRETKTSLLVPEVLDEEELKAFAQSWYPPRAE